MVLRYYSVGIWPVCSVLSLSTVPLVTHLIKNSSFLSPIERVPGWESPEKINFLSRQRGGDRDCLPVTCSVVR